MRLSAFFLSALFCFFSVTAHSQGFVDMLSHGEFKASALDVAFSIFKNNHIVPQIASEIQTNKQEYQHNLAAIRNLIDHKKESFWNNSIYNSWLATLRELSTPTTGENYPEAMRTKPWAMKTTNTQLASWTQLKHDTVLYAKQSYFRIECDYPN